MKKRQLLQQMLLGKVVICLQKTETRSMFITCTSINSKWVKDLNIRPETLKLAQERAGNSLEAIGIDKDFFNRTPVVQQPRERMDKWAYIKL
jgi:trehalose-6-phosphate synthase